MPDYRTRWTPEQDAALAAAYASGDPVAAIARRVRHTPDAVHRRASELGVAHPSRWTDDEDSALAEAYADSTPLADIAEQLGRSRRAVQSRAKRLGLRHGSGVEPVQHARRRWTAGEIRRLTKMYRAAKPLEHIAARLERSRTGVQRKAASLGLTRPRDE